MEDKKRNHSWDEEEIKKYLEQSAEAEEIPPELETENMRKYNWKHQTLVCCCNRSMSMYHLARRS